MGRVKHKKEARASRAMSLTPPINSTVLESRLLGHTKLMKDLLDRGLTYRSLPLNVLKTIVADWQIAGMPVPPSALALVHEHTQETLSRRPAPIWLDPLKMRSIRGDEEQLPYAPVDTREAAIGQNINPKTGMPAPGMGAAATPAVTGARLFTTSSAIPYTPQYRYTKPLGVGQWLPPWMVEGEQANQFVKTPPRAVRPMGVGVRPGFTGRFDRPPVLPSYVPPHNVMLPQTPAASQLPYAHRPMGEAAAIARYGGTRPSAAVNLPMQNLPPVHRAAAGSAEAAPGKGPRRPERPAMLPSYIPARDAMLPRVPDPSQLPYAHRPVGEAAAIARYGGAGPAIAALDFEGMQPIEVPEELAVIPPPIPDRAKKPVIKRRGEVPDAPSALGTSRLTQGDVLKNWESSRSGQGTVMNRIYGFRHKRDLAEQRMTALSERTKPTLTEQSRKVRAEEEERPAKRRTPMPRPPLEPPMRPTPKASARRPKASLTEGRTKIRAEEEERPIKRTKPVLSEESRKVRATEGEFATRAERRRSPAMDAILQVAAYPLTTLAAPLVQDEDEDAAGSPPKGKREKRKPSAYSPKKLGGSPKKGSPKKKLSVSEKARKLRLGHK
jgi:hypothetical protein